MPLRLGVRKRLGRRWWVGMSRGGPSLGRRGRRFSVSAGRHGPSVSVRLARGISYVVRGRR